MTVRRGWQRFEVALTGAFLTGRPLQVRLSDYATLQSTIGDRLQRRQGEGWDYEPLEWSDVAGSYDVGGGYPSLVPLVMLRRGGEDLKAVVEEAQRARPAEEREWLAQAIDGWSWVFSEITVEVFDFGVGVISGRYEVVAPALLSVAATRHAVDAVSRLKPDLAGTIRSPIAASYEAVTLETVRIFAGVVDEHAPGARQQPWLAPLQFALGRVEASEDGRGPQAPAPTPPNDWGRLLWLHPVYLLSAPKRSTQAQLRRLARPFEPDFKRVVELSRGIFAPGIDRSVIVTRGHTERQRVSLMDLILLNWAYYALFMEIDRGLLATLDDDKWQRSGALGALESDAARMFAVYMRVQETKARLNSVLADLGGGALTLWDAIAEAQRFGALVEAVEGKVENLQRVAERRVQEATVERARRTGNILGGLTALTVVTVVIAMFGSIVGSRSDVLGHIELRWAAIVAAFFVAAFLFFRQREIVRRKERARRFANWRRGPQSGH